jgi:hypothetical protein
MRIAKWVALAACAALASAQSPAVGKIKHLIYHDIRVDSKGQILPWADDDPAVAYDRVLGLLWKYWSHVPNVTGGGSDLRKYAPDDPTPGVKKYMVYRTLEDQGIGGDQMAMILSSWELYYAYTGDRRIVDNMMYQADIYIDRGMSGPEAQWPNIPYPCNTTRRAVYDGDLVLGKGVTQPDKAGSFGAELVMLFKITGKDKYLDAAVKIADTLARHVRPGDENNSPLPFKVNAETGEVKSTYTSNWSGTLRLFESLTALKRGDAGAYGRAFETISAWLKAYPLKNQKWGPFFEDIKSWSDTEINAGQIVWYMMDNPGWNPAWKEDVRRAQDWALKSLGLDHWKEYGLTVMGEQSVYKMQGQSHTARHASNELRYAELTRDFSRKAEAVRQLNWATYMVDDDGKNRWPNFQTYEIWWTDGYGDYIRHYLRAMASAPELAPAAPHLLRSSSVCTSITYKPGEIRYNVFDAASTEVLRMARKPTSVRAGDRLLTERADNDREGWTWQALPRGGVLRVRHDHSRDVTALR